MTQYMTILSFASLLSQLKLPIFGGIKEEEEIIKKLKHCESQTAISF